jgi:hypothetical protein
MTRRTNSRPDHGDGLRIVRTTHLLAAAGITSVLALAVLGAWAVAGSVVALAISAVTAITTAAIQAAKSHTWYRR